MVATQRGDVTRHSCAQNLVSAVPLVLAALLAAAGLSARVSLALAVTQVVKPVKVVEADQLIAELCAEYRRAPLLVVAPLIDWTKIDRRAHVTVF